MIKLKYVPTRGTASLVMGISSETMFMNTVRDSITVTPAEYIYNIYNILKIYEIYKRYQNSKILEEKCPIGRFLLAR